MGYMRAHAIVVTSHYGDSIDHAHEKAHEIFDAPTEPLNESYQLVTPILPAAMNGARTFLVAPDGSKEGWTLSDEFDSRRAAFIEWLREQAHEDGSTPLQWVEVQYADDDCETFAIRSSGQDYAASP
jgi:hypothetical protein